MRSDYHPAGMPDAMLECITVRKARCPAEALKCIRAYHHATLEFLPAVSGNQTGATAVLRVRASTNVSTLRAMAP